MKIIRIILGAALFLAASPGPASWAAARQSNQVSVEGTVRDAAGAAVVGARVSLTDPRQVMRGTTETDAEGRFRFAEVPPGSYVLAVSKSGFGAHREAAQIVRGQRTALIITLGVGDLSEEVTVTAETGLAQSKDRVAQQVNVISEDEIQQRVTSALAQVADEEVGVSFQRTSPTVGAVLVRGLTEVGVFVDGVRFTQSTQRGGINTFFNLNEPTSLRAVEVQRGPNTAQYGSDGLGGTVQLVSRMPEFGFDTPELHGELNTVFNSADLSHGSNALVTYGTKRFGLLGNAAVRRINTMRTGAGIDSHSAVTRFLGLPSSVLGESRLPDTAFTQYGGSLLFTYVPRDNQQISFRYQRGQQDGGRRYDQLLGGDGNLVADLRNLMLDFGYLRYVRQGFGFFDDFSATVSYNSQREERVNQGGQGNPLAAITHDKERTTSWGFAFNLNKQLSSRHSLLVGGDIYRDGVDAPSYAFNPASGTNALVRPRVPSGARQILAGLFVQDAYEVVPGRLRLSGALRYNVASYRSRAAESPLVRGRPLWPDDSLRVDDFSGRFGAVATVAKGLNLAFNFSRGFRAPNITNLGSVGLVGVGFQVAASEVAGLGATVGSTAGADAVSTGTAVSPLKSETSNNVDLSLRYRRGRFDTEAAVFVIDYAETIARQTLILPPGAVGLRLGSEVVEQQNAAGAVFVASSPSPVLVQVNFGDTRLRGFEYEVDFNLTDALAFGGNYSYVYAEDRATGAPPNLGGGGIPPQTGFLRLRYEPVQGRYWVEAYSTLAGRQDRLSSLDLADRRTGAARTRTSIQNFFRRGACVRGLTTPGTTGLCGSAGGRLVATGETLAEVQNRVLGPGVDSAPLFAAVPGYGLFGIRGGFRLDERQEITFDFENIGDKNYRAPGWGTDGPGRSLTARYRLRF
jgi:outer membrane receptor protein involved in Fe transport